MADENSRMMMSESRVWKSVLARGKFFAYVGFDCFILLREVFGNEIHPLFNAVVLWNLKVDRVRLEQVNKICF